MTKLLPITIITASVFFASCEALVTPIIEDAIDDLTIDYPYLTEDLDAAWGVSSSFTYQAENGNYWKSPREFEADGYGDCEDFAVWLVYHLGNEASLTMIRRPDDVIDHAIVFYRGQYIEPQAYGKVYSTDDFQLLAEISYDAVMKLSTAMFTK